MSFNRIRRYRAMWIIVFFDLPVQTKIQRKAASGFRKKLLKDGFQMMQYSVYKRQCASYQFVQKHMKRVNRMIPRDGKVQVLQITDKQFSDIKNFWSGKITPLRSPRNRQLELF